MKKSTTTMHQPNEAMEEKWLDVKGYEGLYQVSNLGRVRAPQKVIKGGRWDCLRTLKECILKQYPNKFGYLFVRLSKQGKYKNFRVNRLVAMAFIPNPNNLPVVNHKDENILNNCVDNLEWCSIAYNNNYATRVQRMADSQRNKNKSKRVRQLTLEGGFVTEFPSTMEVERSLGFKRTSIGACCQGKVRTAYGYKWAYV